MPLYVHEVEARAVPVDSPPTGDGSAHGLPPDRFRALVAAVIREIDRREARARSMREESRITGMNRPPTLGS